MDQKEINIYIRILIFSFILLIIILGFVISFLKQNKKFNKEKLEAIIRGSEAERKRISSDLHDELGPILASIKIYVNSISVHNEKDKQVIHKINSNLDSCLDQVRDMSNVLMPNILQRKGLRKALEEFVANMESVINFQFHFVFPEFQTNLNKEMELNLYRIIQEIVTNTIKHSDCTRLEIIFAKEENNLLINSIDNGVGFNQSEMILNNNGCGISNIKNRINLLNGKIAIQSNSLNGTKYSITIPNI